MFLKHMYMQVDSLSRDDLIKQVKKQSLMLQKMKLKLDGKNTEKLQNQYFTFCYRSKSRMCQVKGGSYTH